MASKKDTLQFGIKYTVDQASLNNVKKSLQDLQKLNVGNFGGAQDDLSKIIDTAKTLEKALENAFNVKLNSVNIDKFNQSLNQQKITIQSIYQTFSKAGAAGQRAFNQLTTAVLTSNVQLKQTNSLIQSMGTTMMNTVKWGVASSVMNTFTNSVQQAFQYVKSLDSALTDIRIVTGDSTEQMSKFADQANRAAQQLGRSTMDYTKSALTFYQQGLNDEEVQSRTQAVLKAQNITGAGQQMANYLTAVWNGYKVANEEAQLYVDKLAAVADSSASNMSQLAVAMSKVASAANQLGVPIDSLNAQIATVVATTRDAPQSVGNALKTIYTRINDIATGADDAQVSLGNYSSQMLKVGISVLDANGRLRDTGDVIEQIGNKWGDFSKQQQIYLARTMAGQRQYSRLIALFDNWDKYIDLVNTSLNSQGTTMEKNSRYMDSLEAHLNQLGAASERVKSAMIDTDSFKGLVDFGTGAVNVIANLIESIGGGGNALLMLGSIATQVFSGVIAKEINNVITNFQSAQYNAKQLAADIELTKQYKNQNGDGWTQTADRILRAKQAVQEYYGVMSNQQVNYYQSLVKEIGQYSTQEQHYKKLIDIAKQLDTINNQNKGAGGFSLLDSDKPGNFEQFITQLSQAENKIKELNTASKEASSSYQEYSRVISESFGDEMMTMFNSEYESFSKLDEQFKNGKITAQEYNAIISNIIKTLRQADPSKIQQLTTEWQKNKDNAKLAADAASEYADKVKQLSTIKSFINLAAGVGQLAGSINALRNITNIWKNDTLTTGQKLLQTFTNLGTAIPMLVNSISKINQVLGLEIPKLSTILALQKARTKEKMLQAQLDAVPKGQGVSMEFVNELSRAQKERQILQQGWNKSISGLKSSLKTLASNALDTLKTIGQGIITFITNPVTAIPAAIIAGIVMIAVAVNKAFHEAQQKAKQATQRTKQLKQQFDTVRQKVTDLNSALDQLKSKQDTFNSLAKGTQQWYSALQDVNNQVLDLINKFPELQKYLDTTAEGLLYFREGGEEAVRQIYQQQAQNTGIAYARSNIKSNQLQNASLVVNASRQMGLGTWDVSLLKNLTEAIEKNGTGIFSHIEDFVKVSESQKQKIIDNSDKIIKLTDTIHANTMAAQNVSRSLMNSNLTGIQEYQTSSNKQLFSALAQGMVNNTSLGDQYYNASQGVVGRDSNFSKDWDKIAKRYAELNNLNDAQVRITGFFNKTLQVMDETGEWQDTLKNDAIITAVASGDAAQKLRNSYGQITKQVQQIQSTFRGFSNTDVLADLYTGSKKVSDIRSGSISEKDLDLLLKNAEKLSDVTWQSVKDITNALNKSKDVLRSNFNDYVKDLPKLIGLTFKQLDINSEDYSLEAAEAIGNTLKQAIEKGGPQAYQAFQQIFNQLKPEDILDFTNFDFSTVNSLEGLRDALEDVGIETDNLADGPLQALLDVYKEFQNPEQVYKNIHDIIDKVADYGNISQQDYNTLKNYGIDVEQFLAPLYDGTYALKGVAEDFQNYANSISLQGFINQIDKIGKKVNYINQLQTILQVNPQTTIIDFVKNLIGKANIGDASGLIQYMSALGVPDETLHTYRELQEKQAITKDDVKELYSIIQSYGIGIYDLEGANERLVNSQEKTRQQIAMGAKSIYQLNRLFSEGTITAQQYANSLGYVSQQEVQSLGLDSDKYETYVRLLKESKDEYAQNQLAARSYALQNMRVSQGIDQLIDKWDSFNKVISDYLASGRDVQVLVDSWDELTETLTNLFDIDPQAIDLLGPDFVADHWQKIEDVKNGVENAYEELQAEMHDRVLEIAISTAQTDDAVAEVQNAWNLIEEIASQDIPEFTIFANTQGIDLAEADLNSLIEAADAANWASQDTANGMIAAFQSIADAANWSANEAIAAFSMMGYDVKIKQQPGENVPTPTETEYYHPPEYTIEPLGMASLGFAGLGFPVTVPKMVTPGGFIKVRGTAVDYAPGTYAIESITPKGSYGGNISRQRANAPSRSKGSGGGSKGGGSGSAKKPTTQSLKTTPKQTTHKTAVTDPYHDINLQLKKQDDLLDDLQKKDKKLTQVQRLESITKQNEQLQKQAQLLSEKGSIAQGQGIRMRNQLAASGIGIQFNADGSIANYNQALDNATIKYNKQVDAENSLIAQAYARYNDWVANVYNKASAEQQQTLKNTLKEKENQLKAIEDASKDRLKNAQSALKDEQDLIKNYQDNLQLQKDIQKQIQQIQEQIYENRIAQSKIVVDLTIDTGQAERQFLKWENKVIKKLKKDDIFGNTKASIDNVMTYFQSRQLDATKNRIEDIQKRISVMKAGGTDDVYGTNIAQAQEDRQQYYKQLMGDLQDIQDKVDEIDQAYLDTLKDAKSKLDDQIDQYQRINDIINHNVKLVQLLYGDKGYAALDKYYQKIQNNNQKTLESLKQQQDLWLEQMNKEEVGSQAWKIAKQYYDAATDAVRDKLEEMIQFAGTMFENRINQAIDNINLKLTGGIGVQFLDEQWDFQKDFDDKFLDTVNANYGIREVQRLYQDAVSAAAGNPKQQQKLNDLMNKQLKMLREKDKLTQYDIQRAKQSLEVEKARLALENARDNKTRMRLRRDSQGNYTYQYVADEQKLSELQGALDDAQNRLYNMDKDAYQQNLNDMYDVYKTYLQRRADLQREYANTEDEEEKARIQARIDLLERQSSKMLTALDQQNQSVMKNLIGSYFDEMGLDSNQFSIAQQYKIAAQNIPGFGNSIQDLIDNIRASGGLLAATKDYIQQIVDATTQMESNVDSILGTVGTSTQEIGAGIDINEQIAQAKSLVTANEELIKSVQQEVKAMTELKNAFAELLNTANLEAYANAVVNAHNKILELNKVSDEQMLKYTGSIETDFSSISERMNAILAEYAAFLKTQLPSYDTGGLTPAFGTEGRLALLHEKELVLNAADTQNILAAVESVRQITDMMNLSSNLLDLQAITNGYLSGIGGSGSLDQNVHIEANFPNVTQHTEIEQAFNNLINIASMRASKYGR